MTKSDSLTLGSFSAVDADASAAALVAALDDIASLPAVQRLRGTATEMLAPRLGHRLVDVGCGTGDVLLMLASLVGPTGSVVGIEPSKTMLAEARRRAGERSMPIELRQGDATRLDLDDASFDGARCERVFQHLSAPEAAMAELVRVTKPRGRIVVIDTDWGMHAIHGADPQLTARVVGCWADNAANGWSGRRLPALFVDAGIHEPVVVAETFTSVDPRRPALPPFTIMAAAAERTGALSAGEAEAWLAQLAEAARRGQFFWAATMFAVAGERV
jgi:SAM-dependent methyltransferase